MRFKCVWSKFVTSITLVLLVVLCFAMYQLAQVKHYELVVFLFITIVVCMGYTPLYIEVTQEGLVIKRVVGSTVILRQNITSIGVYSSRFSIRKFGSGGFFGYLGWFTNGDIGSYFSYSTDENNQILIVTPYRKYLISCENKEELLRRFL